MQIHVHTLIAFPIDFTAGLTSDISAVLHRIHVAVRLTQRLDFRRTT
jgi:hypothetical protein